MDSSLLSPPMPASPFQQNPSLDMISIPQIIAENYGMQELALAKHQQAG